MEFKITIIFIAILLILPNILSIEYDYEKDKIENLKRLNKMDVHLFDVFEVMDPIDVKQKNELGYLLNEIKKISEVMLIKNNKQYTNVG